MTLINPTLRNKTHAGPNPIAFAKLILALHQKPICRSDVMKEVGIGCATATRWLNVLKNNDLIYIAHWKRKGNQPVAHWMFGYLKESAPRPIPKTKAQMCRDYRQRQLLKIARELQRQYELGVANGKQSNHTTIP